MGTTIGRILLSYDIDSKHNEVKESLKKINYWEAWKNAEGTTFVLPNTTLWHQSKSTDGAIMDIKTICKSLNVKLEKAIAVIASDFAGV